MDIRELKKHIVETDSIEYILESIGCHSIKLRNGSPDNYYTCANKDGDNKSAITVYINDYMPCVNYTRNISKNENITPDLITLVEYNEDLSFFQAISYLCSLLGIDFYKDYNEEIPKSLQLTKRIFAMSSGIEVEDEEPLKKTDEVVLTYYRQYVNDMFKNDGIDYRTQLEFEIGYDEQTNRITMPIRSEIGDLVGVKGRLFKEELSDSDLKYLYIEKCPRNRILYGLYKTLRFIEMNNECYVTESEKGVMQLWSMGIYNSVGIGGKRMSAEQINKLSRVCSKVIFCFDEDVSKSEMESLADRFVDGIEVWALEDENSILEPHESPTDSEEKFKKLRKEGMIRIK